CHLRLIAICDVLIGNTYAVLAAVGPSIDLDPVVASETFLDDLQAAQSKTVVAIDRKFRIPLTNAQLVTNLFEALFGNRTLAVVPVGPRPMHGHRAHHVAAQGVVLNNVLAA